MGGGAGSRRQGSMSARVFIIRAPDLPAKPRERGALRVTEPRFRGRFCGSDSGEETNQRPSDRVLPLAPRGRIAMGGPLADQLSSDLASLKIRRDVDPERRSPLRSIAVALIGLGAAASVAAVAVPRVESALFKTEVTSTEILLVSPAQASISVTSTGYVVPQVVSRVGAKVPGRVAK